jgi:uncharacterized protein (DUF2225 family)
MMSYDFFDHRANPTFKSGLSSLRAAWLLTDLHRQEPGENWDYLARMFYRKARFYYHLAIEREGKGEEAFDAALAFGPDLDKNYGYHGVIYLAAYLDFTHTTDERTETRLADLENSRRMVARIFGVGKSSKNKPSILLDKAKDLHERIGAEIAQLSPNSDPAGE